MFQWETHVSLGVLLVLIIVIIVPRSVFTKSSSIKLYEEDKSLLFDSDPWPPAEQKLEMPCDRTNTKALMSNICSNTCCNFPLTVCCTAVLRYLSWVQY